MQVRVAPLGVVSARDTELVSPVAVLPYASCTVTTGCVPRGTAAVPPLGWVLKTTLVAAPAVTVKLMLVADARVPSVAVSV